MKKQQKKNSVHDPLGNWRETKCKHRKRADGNPDISTTPGTRPHGTKRDHTWDQVCTGGRGLPHTFPCTLPAAAPSPWLGLGSRSISCSFPGDQLNTSWRTANKMLQLTVSPKKDRIHGTVTLLPKSTVYHRKSLRMQWRISRRTCETMCDIVLVLRRLKMQIHAWGWLICTATPFFSPYHRYQTARVQSPVVLLVHTVQHSVLQVHSHWLGGSIRLYVSKRMPDESPHMKYMCKWMALHKI